MNGRVIAVDFTKGVMDRIRDHLGLFPFDPCPIDLEMWSVSNNEDKFRGCIFIESDMYLRKMRYLIDRGGVEEYGLMNGIRPGMDRVGFVSGLHRVDWGREQHTELYKSLIDIYYFQYETLGLDSSYAITADEDLVGLFDEDGDLDTVVRLTQDGGERHAA